MSPRKKGEIEKEILSRLKKSYEKKYKKQDEIFEIRDSNKTYLVKYDGEKYDGKTIYHDWEDENPVNLKKGEKIFNVYNKNEVNQYGYSKKSIHDDGTGLPVKYTQKSGLMFFPNDGGDGTRKKKRNKRKAPRKAKRKALRKATRKAKRKATRKAKRKATKKQTVKRKKRR